MSSTFRFSDNSHKLTIEEHEFTIDLDDYVGDVEKAKKLEALGMKISNLENKFDKKSIDEIIKLCGEAVDEILGEGSMDKIFEGKKVSILKVIALVDFLAKEIEKARMNTIVSRYNVTNESAN